MQYTTAFVLAVASLAAAQSATSSAASSAASSQSGCGTSIDAIITNCLASTGIRVSACDSQDWNCLCDNQKAVLTCYDNCPSDPNRFGASQTEVSWCNAAKAYGSSSSSSSISSGSSSTSSGSSQTTDSSSATSTDSSASSSTSSKASAARSAASSASSAAAASATDSAGQAGALPASGIMAAALGLAALF